ncbi:MAG: ABC transporter ATP-binding protein [Candidatus Eisenbacteria bacterium]|nr:ABC transporter ATP-binding protein [Candidatus Eisenbacteria bacterium]
MNPSAPIVEVGASIVHVRDLTRRFGNVTAVDDLSFSVARGELFGIVGPDGAGKTTTLRMLAGVLRPTAGEINLLGIDIVRDPERVKARIAYMPQRFGLYHDLTVEENLRFYADLFQVPARERAERMERLFEFSGLAPFRDRLAGRLSGGMKQKLGLSCALVHEPAILLLDEPTFGVDPISRRDLWMIVHEMVSRGVTAVVSTSYMDEAERFDRLAMIGGGRLLALDAPGHLQAGLQGEMLAVEVAQPRAARDAILRSSLVHGAAMFGDRLHLRVDSAERDRPAVVSALEQAGHPVHSVRVIEASLEDVFIERMAGIEERGMGQQGGEEGGDEERGGEERGGEKA